jgi:hypothetical protein
MVIFQPIKVMVYFKSAKRKEKNTYFFRLCKHSFSIKNRRIYFVLRSACRIFAPI